ncbi:hypothetical protein [Burkholderia thailandensis]|uniref:hypothetical protein n=1 Tax=Burkholderia thailandensis TaxID=57975 RepID=UPI0011853B84|nr:hypothetical protein [Burkholderia thailandensis]
MYASLWFEFVERREAVSYRVWLEKAGSCARRRSAAGRRSRPTVTSINVTMIIAWPAGTSRFEWGFPLMRRREYRRFGKWRRRAAAPRRLIAGREARRKGRCVVQARFDIERVRPDAADGRGNGGGTLFLNRFQQKDL